MSRTPNKLPGVVLSQASSQMSTTAVNGDASQQSQDNPAVINSRLMNKLGLDDESILMYDTMADLDEDDDLVFEQDEVADDTTSVVTDDRASKFKTPDCTIKTRATIVVQRRDDKKGPSPFLSAMNRKLIIKVPPSRMQESLSERFHRLSNRMMKRSLTHEQALFNYLRYRGEIGFEKAFGHRQGVIANCERKIAERAKLMAEGIKKHSVMTERVLGEMAEATNQDHETFWREQVLNWITHYEWKRSDGPEVSREELDKEIEEWMSKRGTFESGDDLLQDIDDFMAKKGLVRADAEQLDAELDDYWSKKGQKVGDDDGDSVKTFNSGKARARFNNGFTASDLDADLDSFVQKRKGSHSSGSGSVESLNGNSSTASASMTPQMRMRLIMEERKKHAPPEQLDEDLDIYMQRRELLKKKNQEEKESAARAAAEAKKQEQVAAEANDKFACDEEMDPVLSGW